MVIDKDSMGPEDTVEEPGSDGGAGHHMADVEVTQSPTKPYQAGRSEKTLKCAFCRKDHKKCVRSSNNAKCDRCRSLKYRCLGGLDTAVSTAPKRVLNRNKCDYCREAKQKCLPVDRVWPAVCERCRERNLPCSEPTSSRKRSRVDTSPSESTGHLETDTHRFSQSVLSMVTNQATPPETPQPFPNEFGMHQPLQTGNGHPIASIGVSDGSNLAMLSRAAVIHNKVLAPPPPNSTGGYNVTKYRRTMARTRWQRAFNIIRRGIRIGNIASIFLYIPLPDDIVLCSVCANLGLSRESFVVETKDHHSRLRHESLYQQNRPWSARKGLETGRNSFRKEIKLGYVVTIRKRAHICSFCRLVQNSALDQVPSSQHADIDLMIAYATWEVDGRLVVPGVPGNISSSKPQNRRIRLHWTKGATLHSQNNNILLKDAFVVLVADGKRFRDNSFLGRPIGTGNSVTTLTKDWVEQCQHHDHSHEIVLGEKFHWGRTLGHIFKLLDVVQMRTVSPEQLTPEYVALSYTWGKPGEIHPFFETAMDPAWLERFAERGGVRKVWSELPRTIQDAITLVEELGFRYLWIDALCTVNYPPRRNHPAVTEVFSNAFLTICAADGDGPDAGLEALHKPRKPPIQHIERCGPDLELMVSHPAETLLRQSRWGCQGWTFQEQVFSSRCLIFAAGRVYWECRDTAASEDIIRDLRQRSWSVDTLDNPLRILSDLQDQTRALRAYMRCVEAYTLREFSLLEDVLVAFEGVGRVIGASLDTDLLYGLPSLFLDLALLWEVDEAPCERPSILSCDRKKFPTWSWCGWQSAVTYRASTLSGTLSNIEAWISTHTWISWYVRDRYNITRVLPKSVPDLATAAIAQPQIKPKIERKIQRLKREGTWIHDKTRFSLEPGEVATQPYQQQPVKWPAQNRSMFFKSVPNQQFEIMDVDSEDPEILEHRDTKFLQFWTWSGFFRLHERPLSSSSNLGPGVSRFSILDYKDDPCGAIILPDQWVRDKFSEEGLDTLFELVAISEAKDFAPEELGGWTYYIPKKKEESEWDLWYVLLVEKADDVVVKRIGLGKVFQEAFENSCWPGKEWREFIMA